jgi:16S rRNA (guanine527-N7)-methyltransferase
MQNKDVIEVLKKDLNFSDDSVSKIILFSESLIKANQKHNFIGKSTESVLWHRHILDSAQLVKFIDFKNGSLADLGTGAGFPGIVLAIYNKNSDFHVKLYEKSPMKRAFLEKVIEQLNINATIYDNIYEHEIDASYVVCRAFKKLVEIIQVSREIVRTSHKLIVLKGQNAQEELNKAFKNKKYPYKIESSMTSKDSKIVIINFNK